MPKRKTKDAPPTSADTAKRRRLGRNNEPTVEPSSFVVKEEEAAELWSVRDIIDEKRGKYLVDWDDHPVTHKKYKPTWVSRSSSSSNEIFYSASICIESFGIIHVLSCLI